MSIEAAVFYLFAAILAGSAGAVGTAKIALYAALLLVLAFFTSAAIWLLLEAEFLAITLLLVYVGAVMVLFLFVVMMLDVNLVPLREGFIRYLPVGFGVVLVLFVVLVLVVGSKRFGDEHIGEGMTHAADYRTTMELFVFLYTVYFYPFEIAAASANG